MNRQLKPAQNIRNMKTDPTNPRSKRPTQSDQNRRAKRPAHLPTMTSWITADLHMDEWAAQPTKGPEDPKDDIET